ncbi:MAG: amidohydrolase [Anaerolineales bacterium]|nr:amidohydrolase [Anaerolineales bacterium]
MEILYNARIYTLENSQLIASAIAIEYGRIVAVGETAELFSGFDRAEKRDMGGRIILPGLTDAHLHLEQYALSLQKIDCETDTLDECLRRVEERVRSAKPGEWILGHGWNQNNWGQWPTATGLDKIAPNNPVYLTAKSLHAAWANSAALKKAGLTSSSPDPVNGQLQRDADGQLTGILLETAMELVGKIIPAPSVEAIAEAIEQAQPILLRTGLTGVHDFDRRNCFMALQQLHSSGKLKLRVTKSIPLDDLDHAVELGLRTGFGDDWLRIGSVKAFMDGALGPRTAAMFQPYLNEPENRGILNMDAEELFEAGRKAVEVGLSLAVHAIGDRANHEVLDAYEQLRRFERDRSLPPLRHRIEHVQVIHPDDAGRLAELGIIASMQPVHATSDMYMADQYWGERAALSYAWGTQLQQGAQLVFGSDAPVESPNPFWGLHAAVTRQRADGSPGIDGWYPAQRLSMQQAIEGYTLGAAYAAGMEERLGKLAPGYLADLIVLAQDPFVISPVDVLEMESSATMVSGEWVWQS